MIWFHGSISKWCICGVPSNITVKKLFWRKKATVCTPHLKFLWILPT